MNKLILHEDDHLLVVRKPPGINTHSASPFAGEGIYEWLRRREPRWSELAILHRLDKETSGILVFSKSRRANVSLHKQFARRRLEKEYVLWTDRRPPPQSHFVRSWIRKGRGRFESSDQNGDGLEAQTRFTVVGERGGHWEVRAEPLTGRTHQIRIHAAEGGFPILGDVLYGGTPFSRLCLHARSMRLRHPATNETIEWVAEPDFDESAGSELRTAIVDPVDTNACRLVHGAADGHPGWYVDRFGDFLLAATAEIDPSALPAWIVDLARLQGARGIYGRPLERKVRGATPAAVSPQLSWGDVAPGEFEVTENGLRYRLNFTEGYSVGLFLDQRDNRRRLLTNWIGPAFPVRPLGLVGASVLNVFAYTCGFSVAAAAAGARTTSLDLSRKYLDWGRRNFLANGLDPSAHDFIYGDAFEWLRRLSRKGRSFDVVILDPPTFSQSREHGVFRAETDLPELVAVATPLVTSGGVMFVSTNAARLAPEDFLAQVDTGLARAGRESSAQLFVPQPPDFPTCREEPGYLKTLWLTAVERSSEVQLTDPRPRDHRARAPLR